ncbi:allantoate permease [Aspergillus udagawae]|uniref:Allantoate permease n=1 Tax=Aspergillus udagawae TaxID=91492 RepID=A0ABQ1A9H8_9EURO|nr:allantoate permease [Aspergillus udagawae]GFG16282.1 allantoate permease [Aspergillus udagawae]GFG26596.1 allantoate permease [Aspergillus udagawae]
MGIANDFGYNNSALRTVPETGDLSMDIEAKKFGPAASTEADAALSFLASEGTAARSEIDEKKLVRKIDWMIVPLMWSNYFLQYQVINYASGMGLLKDTGMQIDQFSKLALAFYVSYLSFEFPTGYLMQRLPIAKYLGLNVTLGGLLTTLNCAAQNYAGLIGCLESAVAPALILITSMWYKRNAKVYLSWVRMLLTFRRTASEDEPDHIPAKIAIVATVSVAIVLSVLLKSYYMYQNRRRDMKGEGQRPVNPEFLDLTDRENPNFRYKH